MGTPWGLIVSTIAGEEGNATDGMKDGQGHSEEKIEPQRTQRAQRIDK
jgi:hypothetical protein